MSKSSSNLFSKIFLFLILFIIVSFFTFRKEIQSSNNLEKVNVVYLTDGESAGGDCMVGIDEDGEKMIKSIRYRSFYNMYKHDSPAEAFLVDPKTKKNAKHNTNTVAWQDATKMYPLCVTITAY